MINNNDELKELKEKLNSKDKFSFTDEDVYRWKETLTGLINPLLKRYRVFNFCINSKLILIFISFIMFYSVVMYLINLFNFEHDSSMYIIISIVFILIYYGSFALFNYYISEYTEFISKLQNRELDRMREELYHYLFYQIDLLEECIKRNIFRDKKSIQKELKYFEDLKIKIDKARFRIYSQ